MGRGKVKPKRKRRNKTRTRCADQPTELLEAFMSNQTTVKGGLMPVLGEIEHGMPSKHCFEIGDNCPEHEKKTQMRTSKMRLMRLLKQLVPLPPRRVQTTPEEVSKAFGLKTSKSGRLLVPPLAHWCNQTIAYDLDGGIIAVLDGSSKGNGDNGSFNFKPPEQKDASRIRKKLCNAATERILTPKSAKKACKD